MAAVAPLASIDPTRECADHMGTAATLRSRLRRWSQTWPAPDLDTNYVWWWWTNIPALPSTRPATHEPGPFARTHRSCGSMRRTSCGLGDVQCSCDTTGRPRLRTDAHPHQQSHREDRRFPALPRSPGVHNKPQASGGPARGGRHEGEPSVTFPHQQDHLRLVLAALAHEVDRQPLSVSSPSSSSRRGTWFPRAACGCGCSTG